MEEYLRTHVVPKICEYYLRDVHKLNKCDIRSLNTSVDNFASTLFEINLDILCDNDENTKEEHYSMFVKCILNDFHGRIMLQNVKQFSNEIHIYKTVKPIFSKLLKTGSYVFVDVAYATMKNNIAAKSTDSTDGIIVMENLKIRGYKLGPHNGLDLDHCILALKQLGKWHAMSHMLKNLKAEQFYHEVLAPLQDSQFDESLGHMIQKWYEPPIVRLHKNANLLKNKKTLEALEVYKEKSEDIFSYLKGCVQSSTQTELALLCHGDFCRNNILFKYNENGKPIEAIMVDYQYARYGTPAYDLSLFFYVSTSNEMRKKYFMTLMKIYYESLVSTMNLILSKDASWKEKSGQIVPSFDMILEDYQQHGVIGLTLALFFVPWLLSDKDDVNQIYNSTVAFECLDYQELVVNFGGEAITALLSEMFENAVMLEGIAIK